MAPRKQGRTAPAGACGDARAVRAQFGNGTLRLTTRQTYQLHGVLKQDLKSVFSSVIKNMGSTLGACGDVNRNVLAPPVRPWRPARRPGNGDHGVTEVGHGAAGHFEPGAVPVKACSIVAALTTSLLAVLRHGMRRKGLIGKPMDVVDISVRARAQARSPTGRSTRSASGWRSSWRTCWRRSRARTTTCGWTARSLCRARSRWAGAVGRARAPGGCSVPGCAARSPPREGVEHSVANAPAHRVFWGGAAGGMKRRRAGWRLKLIELSTWAQQRSGQVVAGVKGR